MNKSECFSCFSMSAAAKVTFLVASAFCIGTVGYVFHSQGVERERLRAGILRDIEKEKMQLQNIQEHEGQQKLQQLLEARDREG